MDYEGIIEDIGGFGRWQALIFILISVPDFLFAFTLILPVFVGAVPNWYCVDSDNNQTQASSNVINNTGISNLTKCDCSTHEFNDSFTSIVGEWDLVCENDFVSDLISSMQLAGLCFGTVLCAQMSDGYGRKKVYFLSALLMGLLVALSAFSNSWQMYAAFKFLTGFTIGGFFCLACVYPLEFVSRKWRTLCGTLGFWSVGHMILPLLAYLIRDWRYLTGATASVGFLCLFLWWIIPESPRWLLQRGHVNEAKAIFTNIAVKNKKPVPDMSFLDDLCTRDAKNENSKAKKKFTTFHLFKKRSLAIRTVVCALVWFTILLLYFEFSYNIKHLSGNRYLNALYGGLFDLSGLIVVLIFNNMLGRRLCLMLSLGLMAITSATLFGIYFEDKETKFAMAVTWLSLLGKGAANAGTYLIQIYAAELFPTDIRTIGVGTTGCFGRVGAIMAPQLLYFGTHFKVIPYAVMMTLCGLVLPIMCLVPETNGKPLVDDFNLVQEETKEEEVRLKDIKT